jgi:LPS sulfotransferase NodH
MYFRSLMNRWRRKPGHERFVILSFPRAGTNYLMSLIVHHPHVIEFGELFTESNLSYEILQDPVAYLKEKIYKAYPPEITFVGFKMFYQHATVNSAFINLIKTDKDLHEKLKEHVRKFELRFNRFDYADLRKKLDGVWNYLKDDSELKIIHLKRRNKLKMFSSLKRAYVLNEWAKLDDNARQNQNSVFLDPDRCYEFFNMASDKERHFDAFFRNNKMIDVTYEQLCKNTIVTIEKIYDFLGITHQGSRSFFRKQEVTMIPKSIFQKQNRMTLSESITNYWELKDRFKNTKWIEYFEE